MFGVLQWTDLFWMWNHLPIKQYVQYLLVTAVNWRNLNMTRKSIVTAFEMRFMSSMKRTVFFWGSFFMFMIDSLWERSTACFFSLWEHSRACFFSRQFCSNSCNSSWRLWSRFTNMNKFFCSSRSLIRTSDSLFSYQHILTEYNLDPSIIRRLPNCLDAFIWKIYHLLEFVCLLILSISGT